MTPPVGGFNWVHKTYWDDMKVREASDDARAVGIYLLTCPDRATEGFYRVRMVTLCDDLRMDAKAVRAALDELARVEFARYDPRAEVVLVLKALKYQPPRGIKQIRGAIANLERVHDAPGLFDGLLAAADKYAPTFGAELRRHYGIAP